MTSKSSLESDKSQARYFFLDSSMVICPGDFTTISGEPRYEVIVPVVQTRLPSHVRGPGLNFPKSSPQIKTVKTRFG
jgi:hypothetical protein